MEVYSYALCRKMPFPMSLSDLNVYFKVTIILNVKTVKQLKMVQYYKSYSLIQRQTNIKSYVIYRSVSFSLTLYNDPITQISRSCY